MRSCLLIFARKLLKIKHPVIVGLAEVNVHLFFSWDSVTADLSSVTDQAHGVIYHIFRAHRVDHERHSLRNFVVDANKALVLPEEMSWDHGAMIEPLAVAVHAVRRYAADMTGKKAVVLGGGPIGNLVAQTAKALGAEVVLLSELSAYRLDTAKKCGIATVNPSEKDLLEAITEACGEDRADVIFECIGINPTMKQAIAYARKGSHIVVVGVFGDLATVDMAAVQDHELTLLGSAMYREEDYIKAIELVAAGKIEFETLITHRFGFREFKKGYDTIDLEKDKAMKVMINMEA